MKENDHYETTRNFFRYTAEKMKGFYDAKSENELHHTGYQKRVRTLVMNHVAGLLHVDDRCRSLIDVGCGRGDFTQDIARRFPELESVCGSDFSPETLAIARQELTRLPPELARRISFQEADILQLPFADRSIDITLCINMIHHVHQKDRPQALAELARISSRYIILEIKNRNNIFYKMADIHRHVGDGSVHVYATSIPEVCTELGNHGFARLSKNGIFIFQFLSPISLVVLQRIRD